MRSLLPQYATECRNPPALGAGLPSQDIHRLLLLHTSRPASAMALRLGRARPDLTRGLTGSKTWLVGWQVGCQCAAPHAGVRLNPGLVFVCKKVSTISRTSGRPSCTVAMTSIKSIRNFFSTLLFLSTDCRHLECGWDSCACGAGCYCVPSSLSCSPTRPVRDTCQGKEG
jgi:hypothetical protein